MAYVDGDFKVVVRGSFDNGEVWSNTWAFRKTDPGADTADLIAALHQFYEDVFLTSVSSHTHAVGATVRDLFNELTDEATWATIDGDDLADLLPTSCAIRVSLSAGTRQRGGPFLAGFSVNAVDADGNLLTADQTDIADAITTMSASLDGADWHLGLDLTTSNDIVDVLAAKVGQRFDVIRRRTNEIAESYASATISL